MSDATLDARSRAEGASPVLVGVDVGTTRTKAGVVDLDGRQLAGAAVATAWRDGETSGAQLSANVRAAIAAARSQAPAAPVLGVGVASFAETVVVLDDDGRELAPALAWHDARATGEHHAMRAELALDATTGLSGDAIPSLAVLRRLARDGVALTRARHVLSVAEWIVRDLGGELGAEPSLASRTGALAVATREWWPEALAWTGLGEGRFGPLRQAGASWGEVDAGIAGLETLAGATLTVAGHDHLAAAIGSGLQRPTQVMDSCGTAEALLRPVLADPQRDLAAIVARGVNCGWHVLPEMYNLMVGLRLGLDLSALLRDLGVADDAGHTPLDAAALALNQGETTRATTSAAASAWNEATARATGAAGDALAVLSELGGPVEEVLIGGGWAANPVLRARKRAAFPRCAYPQVAEPGVRGAALLAGQAAGVFTDAGAFPAPTIQRLAAPAGPPRASVEV